MPMVMVAVTKTRTTVADTLNKCECSQRRSVFSSNQHSTFLQAIARSESEMEAKKIILSTRCTCVSTLKYVVVSFLNNLI